MTYSDRVKKLATDCIENTLLQTGSTNAVMIHREFIESLITAAFPEPKVAGYRVTWEETFQDGWVVSGDYFATEVSAKREVARLEQMKSCVRNISRVTALYEIEGARDEKG